MKFNHLVEVNDPLNPLIDSLSPEQVWRGLVLRAEQPVPFVVGLDSCRIVERLSDGVRRELRFGELLVRDRVTYLPMRAVRYDTEAAPDMPAASLTMTIEEPAAGALFVRFEYDSGTEAAGPADASLQNLYDDFRKNAYRQADIDTIGRIRVLAEEGRLDSALN